MKLQRVAAAVAERLHLEHVALGEKLGAVRQVETFAVPLIDLLRPRIDDGKTRGGRPDRVIADLGMARGCGKTLPPSARAHICAPRQMPRNGLSSLSGTLIQSISRRMKSSVVVGAHRAAENHRAGMVAQARRQRIAEPRPAHVERVAELRQGTADTARRGMLLVQDDQYRLWHDRQN